MQDFLRSSDYNPDDFSTSIPLHPRESLPVLAPHSPFQAPVSTELQVQDGSYQQVGLVEQATQLKSTRLALIPKLKAVRE